MIQYNESYSNNRTQLMKIENSVGQNMIYPLAGSFDVSDGERIL